MKDFFIFYSNKCGHSKMLINIINTSNELLERTEFICVDVNNGKRNPLVKLNNIKEVPTLICSRGEGSEVYVGDSAFSTIENIFSNETGGQATEAATLSARGDKKEAEITGYSATYQGLSDSFSTYGEEKPNPLERSFTFLNDKSTESPLISDKKQTEPSKKMVSNQFERLLEERARLNADQQRM
jgi:hypothetical protein